VARLPYVDANAGDSIPGLRQLYAEITDLRGSVHNLHRELANQPEALRAFMGMSRYVRDDAQLAPRLRELAVLATAYALDVPYEKIHHIPAARRVGVTEAQLAAFPDWASAEVFDATERAVLGYADQVARRREVDDAIFASLQASLSPGEIVDLALTVGWYHLCAAILGPLLIETEDSEGARALP
jgi:alkylhydroperoxidase family enzyme